MIARTWRGKIPKAKKQAYLEYLKRTGLKDYRSTKGNLGVQIFSKDDFAFTHLYLITFWTSVEAIKQFAGEQYEQARYYPEDNQYLLDPEQLVEHFEVMDNIEGSTTFGIEKYFKGDLAIA